MTTFKQLRTLNLDGVPVTDDGLETLSEHPNLRTIKLFSNTVEDPKPKLLKLAPCPTLTSADIASYDISCEVYDRLLSHEKLQKLTFTFVDLPPQIWGKFGTSAHNLNTLALEAVDSPKQTEESTLVTHDVIRSLSRMSKLTALSLAIHVGPLVQAVCAGTNSVFDDIFASRLSSIDLSRCSVTDEAIESLLERATNLNELKIDGCRQAMTLRGIKAVSRHQKLRDLSAASCRITDEGSSLLFEDGYINRLNLANNKITEGSVWLLQKNTTLEELDLTGNIIGEAGLKAMFASSNRLQTLSITVQNKISTEVLSLIKKNRNLNELHIQFNELATIVGDEGAGRFASERKFLISMCANVQELYMLAVPLSS
jgi:Leucine-rich repeat (LRR) protein